MKTIYLADAPTYASHIAAYPENGAAILALPAGTRRYIEDMGCEVRRSANGKFWIADHAPTGPVFTGAAAHWIGPANINTITSSAQHLRKWIKPVYYRMPAGLPGKISRISLYQATNGTVGAGTDSCAMKFYYAQPNGAPLVGSPPFNVSNWNAAGSGGAGVLTLANAGANATRIHADLPGGELDVPGHFWVAFSHDLATAPSLGTMSAVSLMFDSAPAELSGTDLSNNLSLNRATHYTFDDSATGWTIGYAPVWGAWEYGLGGAAAVAPHFKVTG